MNADQNKRNHKILLEMYPEAENIMNSILQNSTYGRFCTPIIIINNSVMRAYATLSFRFRMHVVISYSNGKSEEFVIQSQMMLRHFELSNSAAIGYYTRKLDNNIMEEMNKLVNCSKYPVITHVTFSVCDRPLIIDYDYEVVS